MEDVRHYGAETMSEIIVKRMARELADSLIPYINMESEIAFDERGLTKKIRGEIRVLEPGYRF